MRQILLTTYPVTVKQKDGREMTIPYHVRESMIAILFQPTLKLQAPQLLRQEALADKIKKAGDSILVEEEEYERLLTAINSIEGLTQVEIEFVHRIVDAKKVEVSTNVELPHEVEPKVEAAVVAKAKKKKD